MEREKKEEEKKGLLTKHTSMFLKLVHLLFPCSLSTWNETKPVSYFGQSHMTDSSLCNIYPSLPFSHSETASRLCSCLTPLTWKLLYAVTAATDVHNAFQKPHFQPGVHLQAPSLPSPRGEISIVIPYSLLGASLWGERRCQTSLLYIILHSHIIYSTWVDWAAQSCLNQL